MRRLLIALLIWLVAGPAVALTLGQKIAVFSLPPLLLDQLGVQSAAAYSLRLLTRTYTGPLVTLRRSSDNAQMTFYPVGQPYPAISIPAVTAWLNGATPFVVNWYDQSGNGRTASQSTAAKQPALTLSTASMNGWPSLAFNGSSMFLATASFVVPQPLGFSAVAIRTGNFTSLGGIAANAVNGGAPSQFYFNNAANQVSLFSGTGGATAASAADGTAHALIGNFSGALSAVWADGVKTVVATGTPGISNGISIGYLGGNSYLTGDLPEIVLLPAVWSGPQVASMRSSQKSYYGTP